jgi:hypothetical protein
MVDADIILSRCRTATRRIRLDIAHLRLAEAAIEEAALPLGKGWISVPGAIAELRNGGVLDLVLPHLVDDQEEGAA